MGKGLKPALTEAIRRLGRMARGLCWASQECRRGRRCGGGHLSEACRGSTIVEDNPHPTPNQGATPMWREREREDKNNHHHHHWKQLRPREPKRGKEDPWLPQGERDGRMRRTVTLQWTTGRAKSQRWNRCRKMKQRGETIGTAMAQRDETTMTRERQDLPNTTWRMLNGVTTHGNRMMMEDGDGTGTTMTMPVTTTVTHMTREGIMGGVRKRMTRRQGGEPGWDLETARQETRECRELYVHLRKTLGRNHAHTKRAYGGLMEAEEREKEIRGPKNYWQEGRKLDKRRAALRKLMERWEAEYDEEEERFQQATYEHEEKQRGLRDRITDAKAELREIQEKFDAHAQLQETGETGGGPKEDAAHRVLKETAHKVAAIIESAGTGKIEQVTEQLNLLSAELGCSLHQLPRKGQEEGHRSGQGKGSSGESRMQRAEAAHRSEAPNAGRWKNKSQDGTSSGEPVGQGAAGPNDAGEDRREAKLAARARGEGSKAAMETDAGQTGEHVEAAGGAAAAEATGQRGVAEEARRQRALDTIRGRIQLEKHRKLAEKQKELVMQGILPEPHQWTEEQLRQNQRQIEISNAEVDAEVEREFSAMSSEAIAKLLEAAAR